MEKHLQRSQALAVPFVPTGSAPPLHAPAAAAPAAGAARLALTLDLRASPAAPPSPLPC